MRMRSLCIVLSSSPVRQPICSEKIVHFTYKSQGLGQAKPEPSRGSQLWPGLGFEKAEAASGQAKAGALRPSRAGTALLSTDPLWHHQLTPSISNKLFALLVLIMASCKPGIINLMPQSYTHGLFWTDHVILNLIL
jgi:hypothetical protein